MPVSPLKNEGCDVKHAGFLSEGPLPPTEVLLAQLFQLALANQQIDAQIRQEHTEIRQEQADAKTKILKLEQKLAANKNEILKLKQEQADLKQSFLELKEEQGLSSRLAKIYSQIPDPLFTVSISAIVMIAACIICRLLGQLHPSNSLAFRKIAQQ